MSDATKVYRVYLYDVIRDGGITASCEEGTRAEHNGRPMVSRGEYLVPMDESWSDSLLEAREKAAAKIEVYAARLHAQADAIRRGVKL